MVALKRIWSLPITKLIGDRDLIARPYLVSACADGRREHDLTRCRGPLLRRFRMEAEAGAEPVPLEGGQ